MMDVDEATIEVQRKTVVRGYPDQQNPEASVVYTAQTVPLQTTVTHVHKETTYYAQSTPIQPVQSTKHVHQHATQQQQQQQRQQQGSASGQQKQSHEHYADHHDAGYHGRGNDAVGKDAVGKVPVHQHPLLRDQILSNKLLVGAAATLLITSLIALFIWLLSQRRTQRRGKRSVLILGEPDSGKTALWSLVVKNQLHDSVASMTENAAPYYDRRQTKVAQEENVDNNLPERFTLIDIPGHHRVLPILLNKYKHDAVGVVYVINCATLKKSGFDVSNSLYDVMVDEQLSKLPMLIVCNRAAGDDADDVVRQMLEANFNIIRKSHFNPARNEYAGYLGNPNRDFHFRDLEDADGKSGGTVVAGNVRPRPPQFIVVPEWNKENLTGKPIKEVRSVVKVDRLNDWLVGL